VEGQGPDQALVAEWSYVSGSRERERIETSKLTKHSFALIAILPVPCLMQPVYFHRQYASQGSPRCLRSTLFNNSPFLLILSSTSSFPHSHDLAPYHAPFNPLHDCYLRRSCRLECVAISCNPCRRKLTFSSRSFFRRCWSTTVCWSVQSPCMTSRT
jgi:hypothetical protein